MCLTGWVWYAAGVIVSPDGLLPPVKIALGCDPGAPYAHFCLVRRREEGPPEILALESVQWRGPGCGPSGAERIRELVEQAERVAVEAQFLHAAKFTAENKGAEGGYFRSVSQLSEGAGAVAGIAALSGLGPILSVGASTWRTIYAPYPRRTTAEGRDAAYRHAALHFWGAGPGPEGSWRKGDHDLQAALGIALWALGVRSVSEIGTWPPPNFSLPPKAPRRPRARKPTAEG